MNNIFNEIFLETSSLGIQFAFRTKIGGYSPLHWHDELEIMYPLNGDVDMSVEGTISRLKNKYPFVIESRRVHSTYTYGENSMFLCIHILKKNLQTYLPGIEDYWINCTPETVDDEHFPQYLEICQLLEQLTRLYMEDSPTFTLEAEGIILQVLAKLIRNFSSSSVPYISAQNILTMDRVRTVIDYVEKHFREPISLQEIADELGLGREYFCRFFKRSMGISFLQYLNEVRASHVYRDLLQTDDSIQTIMENNGFTNQKLFNRTFKDLYKCTPSQLRKSSTIS